ncbi:hypothetical protein H2O64_06995 [Kordia sp. YSTF-M3]|uniref:DNA topoisomerase (ATP-hydrolyzing) n=1 Tax=Kordia aestuariivivens TaxID=2759037 RepID=A0ABR7Q763_9FLAO|nr:hypothetical protein [Kordia aestuariivivens]MBC8754412.1 hypothetical protein [Kordia aestuariivivens]
MKEKKIEYTADDIQALEGRAHVRLRPQMYFEKVYAEKSLDRLPLEVACHAFDEVMDKNCSYIKITLFSDYFSLEYDAGMSLKAIHRNDTMTHAEMIMTTIAACRNYKKHLSVGDEFCELGITAINAASEWCKLLTYSNGQKGEFLFKEGKTETRSITKSDENKNYTKLTVKPDATIFPNLTINPETLQQKIDVIREKLHGFNIQLHIKS